jgi:YHS domain-containing protein
VRELGLVLWVLIGWQFTAGRAILIAALTVGAMFEALGLVPTGPGPSHDEVFGSFQPDYRLVLNLLGTLIFAALLGLTARRGATDPICGMHVDRSKALTARSDGHTLYFCFERCHETIEERVTSLGLV